MRINRRYVMAGLITFFVIVLVSASVPLLFGLAAKYEIYQFAKIVSNTTRFNLVVMNYSLGYLTSSSSLSLALKAYPEMAFTINQEIIHGPYVLNPRTQEKVFNRGVVYSQISLPADVRTAAAGEGSIAIMTLIGVNNFDSDVLIQPRDIQVYNDTIFSSPAVINGTFLIHEAKSHLVIDFFKLNTKQLSVKNSIFTVKLDKSIFSLDSTCGDYTAACQENINWHVDNAIESTENANYQITSVTLKNNSKLSTQIDAMAWNAILNKISTPYIAIDSATINVNLHDFRHPNDAKLVAESSNWKMLSDDLNFKQALSPHFYQMLLPKSGITFDATLRTSYGNFKATLNAHFSPHSAVPKTLAEFSQSGVLRINISAPTQLVDHMLQALDDQAQLDAANSIPFSATPGANTTTNSTAVTPAATISIKDLYATKVSPYNTMIAELQILVQKSQAPGAVIPAVAKMLRTEMPIINANASIDGAVTNKQITPQAAIAIKSIYANALSAQHQVVKAILSYPGASLRDKLDVLAAQNLIGSTVSKAVLTLNQLALSPELYASSIDRFSAQHVMTKAVAEILKAQYQQNSANVGNLIDNSINDSAVASIANIDASPLNNSPTPGSFRTQFDMLIKTGFVVQDNDNYVVDISYLNNQLSVNGKTPSVPLDALFQKPQPKSPSASSATLNAGVEPAAIPPNNNTQSGASNVVAPLLPASPAPVLAAQPVMPPQQSNPAPASLPASGTAAPAGTASVTAVVPASPSANVSAVGIKSTTQMP